MCACIRLRFIHFAQVRSTLRSSSFLAALRVVASELKVATFSVSRLFAPRADRTVSLLLALRAAVLRLAVSWLTPPGTAATSVLAVTLRPCFRRYIPTCFSAGRPARARGLTLPSSGLAPAGRATLVLHFPFRAAYRCEPLMSNVRPHMKTAIRSAPSLRTVAPGPSRRVFSSEKPNALSSGSCVAFAQVHTRHLARRSASLFELSLPS